MSVQHLDKRPGANNNPFQCQITPPGPVETNGNDEWEVEAILAEKMDRRGKERPRPQ